MIDEFLVPIRSGVTPAQGGRLTKQRAAQLGRHLDSLARFRAVSFAALTTAVDSHCTPPARDDAA